MTNKMRNGAGWIGLLAVLALALGFAGACSDGEPPIEEANCLGGVRCGNLCVDTMVDPANCGGCSLACDTGEVCREGGCVRLCGGNTSACSGACFDLQVSPEHCGECDNVCADDEVCAAGSCAPGCGAGTVLCGDVCADTLTNADHCGGCNSPCGADEVCDNGSCVLLCGGAAEECGGVCTNTTTDPAHCGGCDMPCQPDEVCSLGSCALQCSGGTTDCDGSCVNVLADAAHCGGCNMPCGTGEVCSFGACDLSCGGGTTECLGACVDTQVDPLNCGNCNMPCNMGQECVGGFCQSINSCGTATDCMGSCVNTDIDSDNCGGCGVACGAGSYCSGGSCQPSFGNCTIFGDTFANNAAGWTLDPEWAIGAATASMSMTCGGTDPGYDHSPNNDNGVAGVVLGGDAAQMVHGYAYLTSPMINTTTAPNVYLEFWRWLVSDASPAMDNVVEVFDGTVWVPIYSTGAQADSGWTQQVYNLSAYSNAALQVRFGFQIGSAGVLACPSWNLDDVRLFSTNCP